MKTILVAALAAALAGCASGPTDYAECTVPVKRDAGMGVMVDSCAAWTIGTPTKRQSADFARRKAAREAVLGK